ncbi:MAG: alpha/beta fold hydrolase [Betaproteobacteria bacterium]|nr:alpha/beta fold hydrolase [Betaproteobacteria bacterium]NBS46051.1 alpha/beta fold hydrolase [Betaproteobacteria bacterium]
MTQRPAFTMLGSGHTVLMLHGIGGGHLAFAPQVETLASQGYRAVAWDMPGYGRSAPIEPYTFKGLAQSCIALIEALMGGERGGLTLLGHSMGGMVAQEVVARRPDLVSKLVLCGTSSAFGRKPDGQSADEWQRNFVQSRTAPLDAGQSMAQLAESLVPGMAGPAALPEGLKLAIHCMSQVPATTYRHALEALVTFDRRDSLASIHVPTLLIAGEHDRNAPPSVMKKMADAIAGSTYFEMKGVGHLMNLEAPDEFDGALLNFLALPRILH